MGNTHLNTGILLLFFGNMILAAISAEVRFYTVNDPVEEGMHNSSMSTIIQNLILSAKKSKTGQKIRDAESPVWIQCQSLHKLFKRYKRQFNSDQSMADESWHSITSTAYLKIKSPKSARIPLGVKADISQDANLGCDQTDNKMFKPIDSSHMSDDIAIQMEIMESRSGDLPGHLIPASICGPSKWYNLSPMLSSVWASVIDQRSQSWSAAQASLKKWRLEEGGRLELLTVVLYKDLKIPRRIKELPEGGRRPSGYASCYRLYDRSDEIRAENFITLNNEG